MNQKTLELIAMLLTMVLISIVIGAAIRAYGQVPPTTYNLKLGNTSNWVDTVGIMHVLGQVTDNSDVIYKTVEIKVSMYDKDNKLLGIDNGYLDNTPLHKGETGTFELLITDASVSTSSLSDVHHVIIKVYGTGCGLLTCPDEFAGLWNQ